MLPLNDIRTGFAVEIWHSSTLLHKHDEHEQKNPPEYSHPYLIIRQYAPSKTSQVPPGAQTPPHSIIITQHKPPSHIITTSTTNPTHPSHDITQYQQQQHHSTSISSTPSPSQPAHYNFPPHPHPPSPAPATHLQPPVSPSLSRAQNRSKSSKR